jgi:hypothetical protein
MLSTGVIQILIGSLIMLLYVSLGIKFSGWHAVLLGASGIAYCFLATTSLSLMPVYAVSWVFVLFGILTLAASCCSRIFPRTKNNDN